MIKVDGSYRVSFADTDAGGIVYHARYLEMAEHSRNRTIAEAGMSIGELFMHARLALVLRWAVLEFIAPAMVDDLLTLRSGILQANPARSWWRTIVKNGSRHLCTVDAEIVCLDRDRKEVIAFPDHLMAVLERVPKMSGRLPRRQSR